MGILTGFTLWKFLKYELSKINADLHNIVNQPSKTASFFSTLAIIFFILGLYNKNFAPSIFFIGIAFMFRLWADIISGHWKNV